MGSNVHLPAKILTAGLEFQGKPYDFSHDGPGEVFIKNVSRVRAFIEEKLSTFASLETLVKLSLGDGSRYMSPPIFIDARSHEVKLLESAPDGVEPGITVTIMPEYVLDVIEGRMHPQQAFIRRARPPYLGPFPMYFTPGGRPRPLSQDDQQACEDLPKATEDMEQIKRDLKRWGYALVPNALSPDQAKILRTAVEQQAAGEQAAGIAHMDGMFMRKGDQPNQRVWNLPGKGDEFLDLLNHPLIDSIVPWFLGSAFTLYSMTANIARPTHSGIYMHIDQMGLGPPIDHPLLLNFVWYLMDATEESGATRLYPGSHNKDVAPPTFNEIGGSIPIEVPAGTVLILDSRIWHSVGINRTEAIRPAILQAFSRFFIRSIENYPQHLSEEVKEKLSDRQLALLGFPVPVRERGQPQEVYTAYKLPGVDAGPLREPASH
ncbi:hypothetical protein N8I77_004948 [Diaporthe amygdali]|uniref:Phytanoyl-CoA dioxygenase n=1 Tax=Phomopsis amygdali TaxID=1214568 RepID=A0AAD9W6H7_PHOAM|nr:hypothetical protein N8I77_004948 [Diaporthe amygdali]